jgi:ABC-type glycerol-3-phosphate transport system permease component
MNARSHDAWRVLVMAVVAALVLLPIYAAVVGALTKYENLTGSNLYPADWQWSNFIEVWSRIPLASHLQTSILYGASAAIICGIVGTITGYTLSRFSFAGKRGYLYALLVCQVIPLIVIVVPLFRLVQSLGLYDSYISIIVPLACLSLPFPVLLMKSYFDAIPVDMEEAAMVDGCSRLGALFRIVVPTAVPGILTVMALVFFAAWQTFSLPLVLANSTEKIPVTVGIYRLLAVISQPWHLIMAASIIAVIPPLIIFFVAQRYLVAGLTAGAVK